MTSDPKAPGAAAVYFDRDETTDNEHGVRTSYARIKVLAERGKELATVKIPNSGSLTTTKIEGRTIHADGTIVPFEREAGRVDEYKTNTIQLNSLVFTLPSVEVGSILEYIRIQLQSYGLGPPNWEIQQPYFIHKEHFFLCSRNALRNTLQ